MSRCGWILGLSLMTALGSAGAQAQDPASTPEPPQTAETELPPSEGADWLNRLLEREVEPLPLIEVADGQGFFKAKVPAKLIEPVTLVDGARHLMLDFGAGPENLAECYVYSDDLDLAGSLLSFSNGVFEAIETHYGEVELKAVLDVTAGALQGSPYLGMDWLYRCKTQNGPVAGQAKHLIASKNRRAVYCQSSSVGYGKAFFGLFQSLIETLEYGEPLPQPHYQEVSVASLGEHVLGVSHQAHRIDADGDVEIVEKLSMLVPKPDGQTFQAEDSVTMEHSTVQGDLIGQVEVEAADGQMVSHLNLSRFENGAWAVKGAFRAKNYDTILSKAPVLRSSYGRRLDFQSFFPTAKVEETLSREVWMPEVDPVRISETKISILASQPKGASVKIETGPVALSGLADPTFSLVFVTVPVGAAQMILRQVFKQGDVFHPQSLAAEASSPGPAEEATESAPPEGDASGS